VRSQAELPELGLEGWRTWLVVTSAQVAPEAVAVFYQTDVKRDGGWVDKAHLVQLGAERARRLLLDEPPGEAARLRNGRRQG